MTKCYCGEPLYGLDTTNRGYCMNNDCPLFLVDIPLQEIEEFIVTDQAYDKARLLKKIVFLLDNARADREELQRLRRAIANTALDKPHPAR